MNSYSDIFSIFLVFVVLILAIGIFIRIAMRLRKGGGSMTTVVLGATYEFFDRDKNQAIKVVVNKKAEKKWKNKHLLNQRTNKNKRSFFL